MDESGSFPEWEEFRSQKRGESRIDYLYELFKAVIKQSRDRDHWFKNQLHAMSGNAELLREELMGEGTIFKQPGILRVLMKNQEQIPEIVRTVIREEQVKDDAQGYSTLKKWMWGVAGGSVVAGVTVVIYIVTGVHP